MKFPAAPALLMIAWMTGLSCGPEETPLVLDHKYHPQQPWFKEGVLYGGSTHEPFIFQARRGGYGMSPDAWDKYLAQHTEDYVRKVKQSGANMFHTHFYKGFGIAAERPEMEMTRQLGELVHKYDMKLSLYTQWASLMYETFYLEEPKAKDWIAVDAAGKPIMLSYGYQQSFRYRPCFNDLGYREYFKWVLDIAVNEMKADVIFFDNFPSTNPEPEACHCPDCKRRFKQYLYAKYPTRNDRIRRFGFEDLKYVGPPLWNMENPPGTMEVATDTGIQEWIDFRCWSAAEALGVMADYARSLNPDVAVYNNCHGIIGTNRAFERGIDHAQILQHVDAYVSEENNPASFTSDGWLQSKIRSYKLAKSFGRLLFTNVQRNRSSLAEGLAFNGTIGSWRNYTGHTPWQLAYKDFYLANQSYYHHTTDRSPVALARLYPTMAYVNFRAQKKAMLAEQVLIQNRIPFDLVFDEHLNDLDKYEVLILPDQENMSDAALEAVRRFVRNGGGLVATDLTSICNEWAWMRGDFGLADLFGAHFTGRINAAAIEGGQLGAGGLTAIRQTYGEGRITYLPDIVPPPNCPLRAYSSPYPQPVNADEIVDAVRWAAGGRLSIRVGGPDYLVANQTEQAESGRIMLHLINYAAPDSAITRVPVSMVLDWESVKSATMLSPEVKDPRKLEFKYEKGILSMTIPEVKVYEMIVVEEG
ncbi:alpha-amylase family protein [candidate division KSB1 bacterium]